MLQQTSCLSVRVVVSCYIGRRVKVPGGAKQTVGIVHVAHGILKEGGSNEGKYMGESFQTKMYVNF